MDNIKKKISLCCIEPRDIKIPEAIEYTKNNVDFVNFGENNDFPMSLFDCYSYCSILQSLVNGTVHYISGSGIDTEDFYINKRQSYSELLNQISLDYSIYGAFALQVLKNDLGEIKEVYSLDPRKVRLSEDEDTVYYSPEFFQGYNNRKNIQKYEAFHKGSRNSIYYYKRPQLRSVYGLPIWHGALKSVQSLIEIDNFHLSSIRNQFGATAVISFNNGVPEDEQKKEIEKKINEKFSGSDNASRLMITFSDDRNNAPEVIKLDTDDFDERYQELYNTCRENVFISFRATSQLFGLSPDLTAFNSEEFTQSFKLFNETVIKPIQSEIEKGMARLGDKYMFHFNSFTIDFGEESEKPLNP